MDIFNTLLAYPQVGRISEDIFTNSSGWTTNGDFTFGSTGLNINGSTTTNFLSKAIYKVGSEFNQDKFDLHLLFQVKSLTSEFAIGFTTVSGFANISSWLGFKITSGVLTTYQYYQYESTKTNISVTTDVQVNDFIYAVLSFNLGICTLTLRKNGGEEIKSTSTFYFPFNTSRLSIHSMGGNTLIKKVFLESKNNVNTDLLFIGDSITFNAITIRETFFGPYYGTLATCAGPGDTSIETVKALPQTTKIHAKKAVVMIGTNDYGRNDANTYGANLTIIRNALLAVGTDPYFCEILPQGSDLSSYLAKITELIPSNRIIQVRSAMLQSGSSVNMNPSLTYDGTHPNEAGYAQFYPIILEAVA